MKLTSIRRTTRENGGVRLSCRVEADSKEPFELWFEFSGVSADWIPADRYDAFVAAVYPAALRLQEPIEVDGSVSAALVRALRGPIAELWQSWYPEWRPVRIAAQEAEDASGGNARGLFFSGGIDSFYTFYTLSSGQSPGRPLTHWVTLEGFDIRLAETSRLDGMTAAYRALAKRFGLEFTTARTNLRFFSDKVLSWDLYHGAALAATGLALSGGFSHFYIASATGAQERWGSHHKLDPLWSNGAVKFIHDRVGIPRLEKIRTVSGHAEALALLRVCWQRGIHGTNCSRCDKCLRTMAALDRLGARRRAVTFDWTAYPWTLLALNAPERALHHWRALRKSERLSLRGILVKGLIFWVEIHARLRARARARFSRAARREREVW